MPAESRDSADQDLIIKYFQRLLNNMKKALCFIILSERKRERGY